jgi:hypothetical protein
MVVKREVSLGQRIEHCKCHILRIRNGGPNGAASYPERIFNIAIASVGIRIIKQRAHVNFYPDYCKGDIQRGRDMQ